MTPNEPFAFFITWTVYGSHLQGDEAAGAQAISRRNRDWPSGVASD
jgi:hypothetical protein